MTPETVIPPELIMKRYSLNFFECWIGSLPSLIDLTVKFWVKTRFLKVTCVLCLKYLMNTLFRSKRQIAYT
jgi:hypothetical protein